MLCSTLLRVTGLMCSLPVVEQRNHLNSYQKQKDAINYSTSINTKLCSPKKNVHPHAVILNISKIVNKVKKDQSIEQCEDYAQVIFLKSMNIPSQKKQYNCLYGESRDYRSETFSYEISFNSPKEVGPNLSSFYT